MQFIDLGEQYRRIKDKVDKEVINAIESGKYIMGPPVKELEQRLAAYVGRKYCVSCSNGTDALTMPLMALGIGEGDAVFVPDFTFFASAEVVAGVGATPVFAEVNPDTFNLDAESLERSIEKVKSEGKLTPRMIIAVDLFGQPADFGAIMDVAQRHGLLVMEDGAQGFGGTYNGKKACSFGDVSTTSFFPAKPLGCYGDGGAIFTDDGELAERLRSIRVHGSNPTDKYDNIRLGLNARLDTVQAAVLHCKLDIFDSELVTRQRAADCYTASLKDIVETPVVPEKFTSSWAQYTVKLKSREQREKGIIRLKEKGIPAMIYYPCPMHLQTAFAGLGGKKGDFPVSEHLCDTVMSVPMHPYLTSKDIETVCMALREVL